jgi:type 1 glutamine amidotransferase/HEAT repeat protein
MKARKQTVSRAIPAALILLTVVISPATNAQEVRTLAPASSLSMDPPLPIRTLIVTGQNYHPWQMTSEALKLMLEDTGLFQADIAVSPPAKRNLKGFKPDFAAYRLVVLDYSGDDWPAATRKAFVSYVNNGGGVVVYHSANNTFPKWPEYNEIIGLAGWGERTDEAGPYVFWKDRGVVRDAGPGICGYHGPEHPFLVVNRDTAHPITAGLPEHWMHGSDELYALLRGPAKNLTVLATAYFSPDENGTGRNEPVLFTVTYGAGRIFHTVLGHARPEGAQPALECVGFITTFRRGAEWAATGKVTQKIPADFPITNRDVSTPEDVRRWPGFRPPTLESILRDLDSFAYSKNEEVLYRLREFILNNRGTGESRAACEDRLLTFLGSTPNLNAKLAVCRELRLIGGDKSAAALGPMLLQPETTDLARYALEKIPGSAADKVLVDALNTATGEIKVGIISSLGNRKSPGAVPALAGLLSNLDAAMASASAAALGRIGGKEAAAALSEAYDKTQGALKPEIAPSLLFCVEELLTLRDYAAADGICGKILSSEPSLVPVVLRQAALRGKIRAAEKDAARKLILETLSSGPPELREPAIGLVPMVFKDADIGQVCALLFTELPEAGQVQLLSLLTGYPKEAVQPSFLSAAKSASLDVRVEALKGLAKAGDSSTVMLLAERAASTRGKEQLAARTSLWTLAGKDIDDAVLFWLLASPDDSIKNEFIRAAGERRIQAAKNNLMSLAGSGFPAPSLEAAKALRATAAAADIPALLDVLFGVKDEQTQEEMENTIGAIAREIGDPNARAKDAEALLSPPPESKSAPVTDMAKRSLLLRTLGKIGDDSSLPLLRGALKDRDAQIQDAAVRALADWPSPAPREDVLGIAQAFSDLTKQVLALRGYIRMIGLEKYQSPQAAVRSLKTALDLASRPDEKKLVLGVLPDFACPEALALAESLLTVEGVREEAQAAIDKMKKAI